jgi:hypothetical protein
VVALALGGLLCTAAAVSLVRRATAQSVELAAGSDAGIDASTREKFALSLLSA